jgi:hypothetical protein
MTSENFGGFMLNLLEDLKKENMSAFSWDHEPTEWYGSSDGNLRVYAPPKVDYFQDPTGNLTTDSAPFLWLPVENDFVAQVHVSPLFSSIYDAGCLMVRIDSTNWAKICYERTDIGTTAVVSVVTKGVSDDANGVDLTCHDVWLQVARVGKTFAMHYSLDGETWRMVRFFSLQCAGNLKVGIVAQSPIGSGTYVDFIRFSLEKRTLANLRAGK